MPGFVTVEHQQAPIEGSQGNEAKQAAWVMAGQFGSLV